MKGFADFFSLPDDGSERETQPAIHADVVSCLVKPLDVSTFLADYFQKISVVLPGNGETRVPFSLERLRRILRRAENAMPQGFSLEATFRSSSRERLFPINAGHVGHLLDAGATVCATNIHLMDEQVDRYVRIIKERFSFSGVLGVNCYLSPDGAGFRMHFDSKTAIILQVAGSKRWVFSDRPALEFPRRAARFLESDLEFAHPQIRREDWEAVEAPDERQLRTAKLHPGDVLHFPAGAWHEAQAEGYSLALTLAFQAPNFSLFILPLVAEELRKITEWRAGPPAAVDLDNDVQQENVEKYVQARILELQNVVSQLRSDDPRLFQQWQATFKKQ